MTERIELDRFSDNKTQLKVRLLLGRNVRIDDNGEITWVPTEKIIIQMYEDYNMVNNHNRIDKRKIATSVSKTMGK